MDHTAEIDFVVFDDETSPEIALKHMVGRRRAVTAIVVAQVGPSGHPQARITGPTPQVLAFLEEHGYPTEEYCDC